MMHVALPPHFGAGVSELPEQNSTPQVVFKPGKLHATPLVPSQNPPQVPEPAHAGRPLRGAPGTAMHVPREPAWSHDWHCPLQAESQQTPSTQLAFAHWLFVAHGAPFGSL